MDPEEIKALLKAGIDAARNNNMIIARSIFQQVIDADPRNELAWMWLAQVSDNTEHRRQALEEVLSINPNNEKARLAMDKLQMGTSTLRPASTPPSRTGEPAVRRPASTPPTADTPEGVPNYLRPVQRHELPGDIWANSRRENNRLGFWLTGAVAVAMIGLAVALIILRATGDDEATGPTDTPTPVIIFSPTATIPTATPTQGRIVPPITVTAGPNILPPTWTPSPTWTPLPSPTWTPQPPGLGLYTIVYAGNETAGDPFVLYSISADGTQLQNIRISVSSFESAPVDEAPTEVPTEEGESSDEETPTEVPTEAPEVSGEVEILDPALSPDGTQLVFTVQIGGIQELFLMDYPNGTPRQLTRLGGEQTNGTSWSPDGVSILFASNAGGDFDIYLLDVTKSDDPFNWTNNEEFDDRDPAWSPDAKAFAFASDRAAKGMGQLQIFVTPLQGGEVCQMTHSTNSSFSPAWSPDGTRIAFITNRNTDNDLFVMRSDGATERVLSVNDGDAEDRDPAWSPDGLWLVISSNREDSDTSNLWLASPDGKTWQRVSESTGEARDAQWLTNSLAVGPAPDFEFNCAR